MPKPSEPDSIILKNNYYPTGLKSQDIYTYYLDNKKEIIKGADGRPVLLFLKFEQISKTIVKRKLNNKPIVLTNKNYEKIISGYTLSISVESEYNGYLKEILLDIDQLGNITESYKKECVNDVYNYYKDDYSEIKITNSGKGYHIRINLNKKEKREIVYGRTLDQLKEKFENKYFVNYKYGSKKMKGINIDLSPMTNKGSLTIPYALCRNGLICKDITNNLLNYSRNFSIYKK